MLRLLCHSLLLFVLALRCSAICCNNKNPLCVLNSRTCTPNCADGVSLCNCPKACLNDGFGGCDTSVVCKDTNDDGKTVTVVVISKTGWPTATSTVYTATSVVYTATTTIVTVVTRQSVNIATSTNTITQVSKVRSLWFSLLTQIRHQLFTPQSRVLRRLSHADVLLRHLPS